MEIIRHNEQVCVSRRRNDIFSLINELERITNVISGSKGATLKIKLNSIFSKNKYCKKLIKY